MFSSYLIIPLLTIFSFFSSAPEPGGVPVPQLKAIDKEISAFITRWQIPGASVALVKNGRLLYARSFGLADTDLPTQPQHLFRIASLSKPITAIAIMKLAEQGKLTLTDKVFGGHGILNAATYGYPVDKRMETITVEQLLRHTAGWNRERNNQGDPMFNAVYIARAMNTPAPANAETIIRYLLSRPLDFKPGSRFAYSNVGYSILGRIIEKITSQSYEEFVQSHILHPSGIFDMHLAKNRYEDKLPGEVRYYDEPENNLIPAFAGLPRLVPWQYEGFHIEAMDANGGWLASASDLAKLLTAIDGLPGKPDILNLTSLHQMSMPGPVFRGYALGWMVNNYGTRWHTGSLPGSSAVMTSLPNGISWTVLFNGRQDSDLYFSALERLLWKALRGVKTWPTHDFFEPLPLVQKSKTKFLRFTNHHSPSTH